MADSTKSLWSRLLEGGSEKLSNVEPSKRACPYDGKSCAKAKDAVVVEGVPRSSSRECHSGCPEPKRHLQPEEFCPELGRAKPPPPPPPCCFIRMQNPCAPCCCPPPDKCEDECHPGPRRDPICGCDLCKKKQCPDGKCCGATEPSCQQALSKCNSGTQTSPPCAKTLEPRVSDIYTYPKPKCEPPVCQCEKDYVALLELIRRPLDWLLCTPLKIPIPRLEWHWINDPNPDTNRCDSKFPRSLPQRKYRLLPPSPDGDFRPRPRCCNPHDSTTDSDNANRRFQRKTKCNENTTGNGFSDGNQSCECGPCRVRCLLEGFCAERSKIAHKEKWLENSHPDTCGCKLCRVRRALEKPIC